jgi:protein ImuA
MTFETKPTDEPADLQQLLCRRSDVWRGLAQAHCINPSIPTGHGQLDEALLNAGWPKHSLIEICQGRGHAEWQLLRPLLAQTTTGHIALINPPTRPFPPALIQMGIDLDRLIIVEASQKADWMMAVLQLARTEAFTVVIGWQPKQGLSYTELRKCQLASAESQGLLFLFRPDSVLQQSSPASLRMSVTVEAEHLGVTVVKQRGMLAAATVKVRLPLPRIWLGGFLYHKLNQPVLVPVKPKRTQRRHLRSV